MFCRTLFAMLDLKEQKGVHLNAKYTVTTRDCQAPPLTDDVILLVEAEPPPSRQEPTLPCFTVTSLPFSLATSAPPIWWPFQFHFPWYFHL